MKPLKFHVTNPSWYETVFEHPAMDEIESTIPYRLGSNPPDWFRNAMKNFVVPGYSNRIMDYKGCPVPHNIMKKSIVLPAPCDIMYGVENDKFDVRPEWKDFEVYHHGPKQLNGYAPDHVNVKFNLPYYIETPKKMNMWITPPFLHNHHFDMPFEVMFGLVNVNRKMHATVNCLVKRETMQQFKEGDAFKRVPCGEPMAYVIFPDYPGKVKIEFSAFSNRPVPRFLHKAGSYFRID